MINVYFRPKMTWPLKDGIYLDENYNLFYPPGFIDIRVYPPGFIDIRVNPPGFIDIRVSQKK